ncbi:MAG: DUF342 domain-containing protein [Clostridiales bacterium]|nr:DUF342 domain-containing protein [Clostridiales bacterium]
MNNVKLANYSIEYQEDGVYLTVFPSENGLTKEDETEILDILKRKSIIGIDTNAVYNAMYISPGNKAKIAPTQKEKMLDQEIKVRVVNGGMEARAKLLPAHGGKKLSLEEVIDFLNKEGIVFGIDHKAIEQMLKKEEYYKEVPIAYGQPAQKGQDAKITYHININPVAKPKILEDGTVDYRHLDLIQNVKKGQLLASLTPHTEGIPGKTVLDKVIEAKPGKRLSLPKGKNVILSEDGLELLAAIDGKAEMIDGKINVYAVYEVFGNVDNSTGNIDFIGNVIINGNVLTGFEVKAGGYIEVRCVVEGANLTAQVDVVLKKGIQGMGKGIIETQGNVIARFIENSTVSAKGNVTTEAILHSNINCGGKVEVAGRKGLIAGGSICAGDSISAVVIGSPMATVTELKVGTSPILREEHSRLTAELDEILDESKKSDQILNLLNKMESKGRLSLDKSNLRIKAIKTKLKYSKRLPEIKKRIVELEEIFKDAAKGRVNVQDRIYPGVKIEIGSSALYIKDEEQHVTFIRKHGEVVRTAFLG